MPRKQFILDLEKASTSDAFPHIQNIRQGDDNESLCFSFFNPGDPQIAYELQVAVSDLTEYPHTHQYLIFSTSATVPPAIIGVLEGVQAAADGYPVSDLLNTLHDALEKTLAAGSHEDPSKNPSGVDYPTDDDAMSADSEAESENEVHWDDGFFDEDQQFFGSVHKIVSKSSTLRPDLRTTKAAGFKVGYLGDPKGSLIISISCRISKLGISEEAMQAWDVKSNQYLVLLLRFPNRYVNADYLLEASNDGSLVQMHVGLCASYKPSVTEALQAFARTSTSYLPTLELMSESDNLGKLLPLFLEIPLGSLLNERFITILKLRHRYALSWSGAESLFNDSQGLIAVDQNPQENHALYRCKDEWSETVPHLVQDDHFTSANDPESLSFPLLAIQFTLRHFVKCTEFCLVCHCKIDTNFEALKPYVCSKPLCLYQYMALGMGPSLEWEITRQPLVIDLLISFAYASATAGAMEELPVGLRMMVPPIHKPNSWLSGSFYRSNKQLTVDDHDQKVTIKEGDWILIDMSGAGQYCYCRVERTDRWPIVEILEPVTYNTSDTATPGDNESLLVKFALHDVNFDDIESAAQKQTVIVALLQSLPDVLSMKSWLESAPPGSRSLAAWKNVPPAALDLLRWIVASNRSCIMQDGDITEQAEGTSSHNLVTGMKGYLQFRFAQGSPDKEEKFVSAVSDNSNDTKHPTIFAWHGSSLSNWHSIIREGLHFKKTTNGRAFGHGVYMAQQFHYSLGYSGRAGFSGIPGMRTCSKWPKSILNVNVAVSLNEVVNRPHDFVNSSNGVYVVNRIEWIQTRYLFVDCQKPAGNVNAQPTTPVDTTFEGDDAYYVQDPKHTAMGSDGKQIRIPMTIFSRCRRNLALESHQHKESPKTKGKSKKCKKASSRKRKIGTPEIIPNDGPEYDDDDVASVATLAEDLAVLFSDAEEDSESETLKAIKKLKASTSTEKAKVKAKNSALTPFEPGTLTESSVTLLEPPAYASSSATKTLQQRLLQALKVQEQTPPDELGWCIDPQLINNPYQWIVELHSFELSLPLGQDLQKAGLQSVVLEMRFPHDFPMSPPFVRVIRPRFLEFNAGGGGHITMGGALCMELLTGSGWLPTFSIENVLLSIRLALCSVDPKPARLANSASRFGSSSARGGDYSVQEAVAAYTRACRAHGWEIPKNFEAMAW
ncbi:uncharacterized protein BHQ10_000863 [Talaromyces amestolkiae]|uniref:UBC core domain-containing protein n=1 Tax=Talaromyces amestolkiae TaxID=1196081 RepID=A0A364KMW0_TALAM|nr:uncharacterized protein BHQ10_000863 [Talaromyces amestolkiae]RAO64851.1 hypothetical protein BHQ10_000863 [Talaromyces amestolkiae]